MEATPLCTLMKSMQGQQHALGLVVSEMLLCDGLDPSFGVDGVRYTIFSPLLLPLALDLEGVDRFFALMEDCFDVEGPQSAHPCCLNVYLQLQILAALLKLSAVLSISCTHSSAELLRFSI